MSLRLDGEDCLAAVAAEDAAASLGVATARLIVSAELVPWALGYSDPVRKRVEARERKAATGG